MSICVSVCVCELWLNDCVFVWKKIKIGFKMYDVRAVGKLFVRKTQNAKGYEV